MRNFILPLLVFFIFSCSSSQDQLKHREIAQVKGNANYVIEIEGIMRERIKSLANENIIPEVSVEASNGKLCKNRVFQGADCSSIDYCRISFHSSLNLNPLNIKSTVIASQNNHKRIKKILSMKDGVSFHIEKVVSDKLENGQIETVFFTNKTQEFVRTSIAAGAVMAMTYASLQLNESEPFISKVSCYSQNKEASVSDILKHFSPRVFSKVQ